MDEDAAVTWTGRLLVATPELAGPVFARSVVLLLQHGPDDGALGVVLTTASGTDVDEVLPGWQDLSALPGRVFVGGPVQPEAAICLAELAPGAESPHVAPLPSVAPLATVDLDAPPAVVAPLVQQVRVFAGCAGWSAGQLEAEVAQGWWFVVEAWPGDAFRREPERLWRQVLRRQGGRIAFASTWPDDPAQN